MDVRFGIVTREQVLGALKATGSTDPDVLLAAKEEFAASYRPLRWFGIWALVCGALCTALVLLAFIGIPLLFLGWWWLRRAKHNRNVIEAAFAEHLAAVASVAAPGGRPAGAPAALVIGLALLVGVVNASMVVAQNDVVPADLVGDWGPGGSCSAPLKLVLAEKQFTLVHGKDKATHGNIAVTGAYFGNEYQGIMLALLPDYDKSQPYVVTLNAGEKRGDAVVDIGDPALKRRFPFGNTILRKCGAKQAGAGVTPAAGRVAAVCAGHPRCAEVTPFAATITDFRVSGSGSDKIISYTVRFQNKLASPLILGFVQNSGLVLDDQGVRFGLYGANALRGIGQISGNTFDPKFVLQPGETGDARVELASRVPQGTIFGTVYDAEFAVREIEPLPGNQYQLGKEHLLQIKGLTPAATVATATTTTSAGPTAPMVTPASSGAPSIATTPEGDACAGKARCYSAGPFAAAVAQATTTKSGGYQTLRLNVRVRNVSSQPLILGFKSGSQTSADDVGDRLRSKDEGVKGIGLVSGGSADPQFTLNPGQERAFTLDYYKGIYRGTILGTVWSADFVLQQLEILPSRQVRTVRDYAISFQELTPAAPGAAAAGTAAGQTAGKLVEGLFKKKK